MRKLDIRWIQFFAISIVTFLVMLLSGGWMRGLNGVTNKTATSEGTGEAWDILIRGESLWTIGIVICFVALVLWADKALEADLTSRRGGTKMRFMLILLLIVAVTVFVAINLFATNFSLTALYFFGLPVIVAILVQFFKRPTTSTS